MHGSDVSVVISLYLPYAHTRNHIHAAVTAAAAVPNDASAAKDGHSLFRRPRPREHTVLSLSTFIHTMVMIITSTPINTINAVLEAIFIPLKNETDLPCSRVVVRNTNGCTICWLRYCSLWRTRACRMCCCDLPESGCDLPEVAAAQTNDHIHIAGHLPDRLLYNWYCH